MNADGFYRIFNFLIRKIRLPPMFKFLNLIKLPILKDLNIGLGRNLANFLVGIIEGTCIINNRQRIPPDKLVQPTQNWGRGCWKFFTKEQCVSSYVSGTLIMLAKHLLTFRMTRKLLVLTKPIF